MAKKNVTKLASETPIEDQLFQTFVLMYPIIRPWMVQLIDDPDANWDDEMMKALDDLANADPAEASRYMVILEWNYAQWMRPAMEGRVPLRVIGILDKLLDYA